jgi:RNA polymerase sigma-70 factor, ECF subfamily
MQSRDVRINQWLKDIAGGDETALRELYRMFGGRVYAFALNFLREPAEAQEVVVDTLYEVWKHAHKFRGDSKASTWVLGIARNKMLMKLRARGPSHEELPEELSAEHDLPPDPAESRERLAAVRECMGRLPPEQRQCLHLAYFEDLSLSEIAVIQGCPENTVKTRLFHARRKIKPCLSAFLEREGL